MECIWNNLNLNILFRNRKWYSFQMLRPRMWVTECLVHLIIKYVYILIDLCLLMTPLAAMAQAWIIFWGRNLLYQNIRSNHVHMVTFFSLLNTNYILRNKARLLVWVCVKRVFVKRCCRILLQLPFNNRFLSCWLCWKTFPELERIFLELWFTKPLWSWAYNLPQT